MTGIQMRARIDENRVLHVQLPEGTPTGNVEVTITVRSCPRTISAEERRAAAWAGYGSLKHLGGSVEEFLAERRDDEARRDEALG